MAELNDGDRVQVKGSGSSVYTLKNSGGVFSCTCPAWMHQGLAIERRTCKHLRAYRGDEAETARVGAANLSGRPPKPKRVAADGAPAEDDDDEEGPPVLLAHKWESDVDLTGWWLLEKLDGVRAIGMERSFSRAWATLSFLRHGSVASLPQTPLDGELWGARKLFQRTVGIVIRQDQSPLWKELQYVVFDAPSHGGVFEERVAWVEQTLKDRSTLSLVAHHHHRCENLDHLRSELARVEGLGGEGLMARQPRSRYEAGRSSTLLKVKSFHDTEAKVLGHVPGQGRHKGRLGALFVQLPDGTTFNVGTGFSDAEREKPPAVGSIITFRYQELSTTGVPRFPSFVGERIDAASFHSPTVRRVEGVRSQSAAPPVSSPLQNKVRAMPFRRFEMTDGDTRYFWEVEVSGLKQKIRFGTFEQKEKLFEDGDEASAVAEVEIAKKVEKGFVEVLATPAAPAAAAKNQTRFGSLLRPTCAVTTQPSGRSSLKPRPMPSHRS